jgi:hypothetical protein
MKKKKIDSEKVLIEFDERHLSTLTTALEVYSRLRSGQIKMAIGQAFGDINITYEEGQFIENSVRFIIFPPTPNREYDGHGGFYDMYNNTYDDNGTIIKESDEWKSKKNRPHLEHLNSSFGVGCEEMKDGTVAWEIKKAIEQYLHYQRNGGMRRICDVSGDGPLEISGIPAPKFLDSIKGYWKPQKEFRIPQGKQESMRKAMNNKDYEKAWDIAYSSFKKKPLPTGNKTRIEDVAGTYYVIVEEPYKSNHE